MSRSIYFLVLFSFFLCIGSIAQQNRFVYIQTENKQPFYIRINNTVFSSSASGYLIIPKLKDGSQLLNIGFPRNEWPQQTISITLNKKDAGYVLKNFGEKGWGLFNLQTMEVLMAKGPGTKAINTSNIEIDDDPFTQALSDVVNTPDLKKKVAVAEQLVKEQPKKEEPVVKKEEPAVRKDELVVKRDEPVVKKEEPAVKKEQPIAKTVVETTGAVKLVMNNKDDKGRVMIYIDESGGMRDTIRLFIPAVSKTVTIETAKVPAPEKAKEKFIEIELPNPNSKKDTVTSTSTSTSNPPSATEKPKSFPPVTMVNSDCKANASDDDFMKLRKKMAAAENDEEMVAAAKKGFKSKCYSTSQVKNLSVLFLNDAGRYKFFDAAYPAVYDTGNFSTLEQQLTDPYFITRFQAMIRR